MENYLYLQLPYAKHFYVCIPTWSSARVQAKLKFISPSFLSSTTTGYLNMEDHMEIIVDRSATAYT